MLAEPDSAYVQALFDTRGPQHEPVAVGDVIWGSRFRVHHRLAQSYQHGRVLLAGDAAHVHSPAGGQGMNTGIHDGIALAQALAATLATGDGRWLQQYQQVRRPAALQVMRMAHRLTRMATARPALRPMRNALLSTLGKVPAYRRQLAWQLSGLAQRRPQAIAAAGWHAGPQAQSARAL